MNFFRNRIVRTLIGGLISLVYQGLGHIFARKWALGAGLLAFALALGVGIAVMAAQLAPTPQALGVAGGLWALATLLGVVSAIDAARRLWRRDEDVRPTWYRSTWFAAILAIAVSAGAGEVFPRHWRSFSIPSGAMIPTLHVGDYIMADMHAFKPANGDVVLFKHPVRANEINIKRVVGMPGDSVQMKAGRLLINGATVAREPIDKFRIENPSGATVEAPTYRETLANGVAHDIVEIQGDTGFLDDTPQFTVPAGNYFVVGDNRDNSSDSRLAVEKGGVGYVPGENIIGKAGTIFWSRDRSRILRQVR